MSRPDSEIRSEFDRLAGLAGEGSDSYGPYEEYLLRHVPRPCDEALEIGCGAGAFTRKLALRARRVTALDLSPAMIETARERSSEFGNINYVLADASQWRYPVERFDCVASIATLHHLRLEAILGRLREALTPGGVLLVLDLFEPAGLGDMVRGGIAWPVSRALFRYRTGRWRPPDEVRRFWDAHGRKDEYPGFDHVREICADALPGARVRKHLLWRYSIVWRKPTDIPGTIPSFAT
jgi:SAM-dependent methyltransferase